MASSSEELKRLQDHSIAIRQLAEHPGWAVFVQAALATVRTAKAEAATASTPHQMAFHMGSALTLEQLLDWPRRELEMAKAQMAIDVDNRR